MNQVFIYAKFEKKPSENEIEEIEKEISYFLLELCGDIKLELMTGEGSWWIIIKGLAVPISGWFMEQLRDYLAQEVLDKMKEKALEKLDKQNQLPPSQAKKFDTDKNNQLKKPNIDSESFIELTQKLNSKTVILKELIMSEWSESKGKGKCISIEKTEQGFIGRQHDTDSKEDFDSYLSKLIDRR